MPRSKAGTRAAPSPPSTSRKPNKHQLSSPATATPGSRTSKRLKNLSNLYAPTESHATPQTSKYFEEPESDDQQDLTTNLSLNKATQSAYEDGNDDDVSIAEPSSASSSASEDDYDSEEEARPKKKRGRQVTTKSVVGFAHATKKGEELWRPGVKTGLGPGKQVYVEKPKPRGEGGIKYAPERIHPNTMAFLADLKKNNDRQWLKSACNPPCGLPRFTLCMLPSDWCGHHPNGCIGF